jgi:hypothetical protein
MNKVLRVSAGVDVMVDVTDVPAALFAKEYVAAERYSHKLAPSMADEAAAERFHEAYDVTAGRSGFAGSGEWVYTSRATGQRFMVRAMANGRGFYGTSSLVKSLI